MTNRTWFLLLTVTLISCLTLYAYFPITPLSEQEKAEITAEAEREMTYFMEGNNIVIQTNLWKFPRKNPFFFIRVSGTMDQHGNIIEKGIYPMISYTINKQNNPENLNIYREISQEDNIEHNPWIKPKTDSEMSLFQIRK
ncbi:MAG: hypothetical protein WC682_00430 [Parcubacteria group bacterium]|jgi:hypothetical protein